MRGEFNQHYLSTGVALGVAVTEPMFQLRDLGPYPGLFESGQHHVVGEIFLVDDNTRAELDRLEAHPKIYRRQTINLVGRPGVEGYVLQRKRYEKCPLIERGDWRTYRQNKR